MANKQIPRVIFKFDEEKDLWNIWDTCNNPSSWYDHKKNVSKTILEICEGKSFKECKNELIDYRKKMYDSEMPQLFAKNIQKAWNKINDEYFKRLEKITKRKFKFKKVTAYITTVSRCPYNFNEPSFMISIFKDMLGCLTTCGHELLHIQFHHTYWDEVEKQIGKEKTADLKEALTSLLNSEFKELWFVEDRGYEAHIQLREYISTQWKKDKDFDKLIAKCIQWINKNEIK